MSARRRPWYGFVYYVLGTRGSFFAWVVALLGVYVTWREAVYFTLNQGPRPARVVQLVEGEPSWRRWVQVGGVEVDLKSPLFAAYDGHSIAAGEYDRVLIDREDPIAGNWREVFREIEEARSAIEGDAAVQGDEADAKIKRLGTLLLEIGSPEGRRFLPEKGLIVIFSSAEQERGAAGLPTRTADARPPGANATSVTGTAAGPLQPEDHLSRWRRSTLGRIDLVRRAVRIDVEREGWLGTLPDSRRAVYKSGYGIVVAHAALGVGQRPSQTAAAACAGFVFVLVFLVLGLRAGPT